MTSWAWTSANPGLDWSGEENRRPDRLPDPWGFLASDSSPSRQTPIAAATLVHVTQNDRPVER